ncbi:MAG: ABC transporter substrate-binding protein [Betaproteobacteria bacterium]
MNQNSRRISIRGLLGGIFFCAVALFAGSPTWAQVVVGQVVPLSGVLATTGQQMALGPKLWFDYVNDHGGVNGQKIRHVVVDDGWVPERTVNETKAVIEKEKPVALIAYAGTGNINELLKQKILEKASMPLVAPYTGGEPLRAPFNPWIFHIRASYADETAHMVDHLATLGIKKIAVFFQDDAFGRSGLAGVETAAAKHGAQIVARAGYERNTANVVEAIKQVAAAKPSAVIMVGVNKPIGAFIKGYREAGGTGMLFSISVVDPAELVAIAGINNVRGLAITQPVPFPYGGVSPLVKEFNEVFKKYAPKDATVTYAVFEEYIGAKVLVEGIKRAGKNPTPDKVVQGLASLGRLDLGGFVVNFSPENRIGSRFVDIVVVGAEGRLLR